MSFPKRKWLSSNSFFLTTIDQNGRPLTEICNSEIKDMKGYQNIKLESPFEGDRAKIKRMANSSSKKRINTYDKFFLGRNVYLVRGAVNSVLHDFNNNVLYWLNQDTTNFLNNILRPDYQAVEGDINALRIFLNAGIITSDKASASVCDIETLFNRDYRPQTCYIELTQKCNLRCKHCYNAWDAQNKKELSPDEVRTVLDELSEYGIKRVHFIGGEPLLLKGNAIFQILDYASPRFESIKIFTNGTMIDDSFAKKIAQYPNVSFAIGFYSFDSRAHDHFTGVKGSQKKTYEALKTLRDNNIEFDYSRIYAEGMPTGEDEEFAPGLKMDYVRLAGRGSLQLYNEDLLRKRLKTLDGLNYEWSQDNVINLFRGRCFSRLLYVSCELDVFPCAMERRLKHGNLKDGKLADIVKKDILNFSKTDIEECRDCEFRYICVGCPPDSLNGKLEEKPWNCTYNVYKGEWDNPDDYIKRLISYKEAKEIDAPLTGSCRIGSV